MRTFLLVVFLLLTGLYGFQLWSKYRKLHPPAPPPAVVDTTPPTPTPTPDLTPFRLALEKSLNAMRISSVMAGASPIAQIGGGSYTLGQNVVVPGSQEKVTIRDIGDGFVLYATPYHPSGFRVDLSRK